MNKKLALSITLCLLSACAEQDQYEQAVLAQLKNDKDITDYHIDPERMASCVVDTSSQKMPGAFPLDPERKKAYLAYAKMVDLKTSQNPEQVMKDLRTEFGSAQELSNAHSNYSESILNCQTAMISEGEQKIEEPAEPDSPDGKSAIETAPTTQNTESPIAPAPSTAIVNNPPNTITEPPAEPAPPTGK